MQSSKGRRTTRPRRAWQSPVYASHARACSAVLGPASLVALRQYPGTRLAGQCARECIWTGDERLAATGFKKLEAGLDLGQHRTSVEMASATYRLASVAVIESSACSLGLP